MQELVKALIKAQQAFQPIEKDAKNTYHNNRYATLDSVLKAVNPALHENGLTVIQTTDLLGDKFVLVTRLLHESGGEILSNYLLPEIQDPQKLGSALTYARRYALCSILNVTADADDDGESAKPAAKTVGTKPTAVPSTPKPSNPNAISESQLKRLYAITKQHGVSKEDARKIISEFGFESSKDITPDKYEAIIEAIKAVNEEVPFAG